MLNALHQDINFIINIFYLFFIFSLDLYNYAYVK